MQTLENLEQNDDWAQITTQEMAWDHDDLVNLIKKSIVIVRTGRFVLKKLFKKGKKEK